MTVPPEIPGEVVSECEAAPRFRWQIGRYRWMTYNARRQGPYA